MNLNALIFLTFILLFLLLSACKSTVKFEKGSNQFIKDNQQLVEQNVFIGKLDHVDNGEAIIHFESIGDPTNPTILLIMGFGTAGMAWSKDFIQPFIDQNFHVIRYDNRDTGKSKLLEKWTKKNAYVLKNMAFDAISILDKMNIGQAHVVGISMGGMIGQEIAIHYPNRLKSLTSMFSTGFYADKELKMLTGQTILANARVIFKYGLKPKKFKKRVKKRIQIVSYLRNDEIIDHEKLAFTIGRINFQDQEGMRGHPDAERHHSVAIRKAGSRLDALSKLDLPVLILHGKKDVLILHEHSEKLAKVIPNSELILYEATGHIPRPPEDNQMANDIIEFIQKL